MKRRGTQARIIIAVVCAAVVMTTAPFALSRIYADDLPTGPSVDTRIRLAKPSLDAADMETVWRTAPLPRAAGPRGVLPPGALVYDNGEPLDDVADTATQFSLSRDGALGAWRFVAAIADDFMIEDFITPDQNVRLTTVRTSFAFFNLASDPNPSPSDLWTEGAYVVIYENSVLDIPAGQPDVDPTNPVGPISFLGPIVAVQQVPLDQIVSTEVGDSCNSRFVVDITVDIEVQKNHRYWLSVIPRYPAPPQTQWIPSATPSDGSTFDAHIGFPTLGIDFWTPINGNFSNIECPEAPSPGTHRDVSFQLYGEDTSPTNLACCDVLNGMCFDGLTEQECLDINPFTIPFLNESCSTFVCPQIIGACCNDTTGICTNNVLLADCINVGSRFVVNGTCANLDPPCGTTDLGACCLRDGTCQDLSPTACSLLAGDWFEGDCLTTPCPAANDDCVDAQVITGDGIYPFSTVNATTDGPFDSPGGLCTNVNQDVWFRYIATCDGDVTAATCFGTNYDSAINVYDGCFCDSNMGPMLACSDNGCGPMGDDASVMFAAQAGECYLIRVGGKLLAEGNGLLVVGCVPAQVGACCDPLGICTLTTEAECMQIGGEFTEGQPCSPITCAGPDNDECATALSISEGIYLYDNMGATTSMEDQPGGACPVIDNDIWFRHTVQCDGTLIVSTCDGTAYDSAIAVYADDCANGPSCMPLDTLLGCDDDGCGVAGGPSEVRVDVVAGQCVLIRVGGVGDARGTGTLLVTCVPSGQGACCDALTGCELRMEADCQDAGDVFSIGQPCVLITCEPPVNDDCDNATEITNGVFEFTTLRATTDGPTVDSCLPVEHDVWFRYSATCDGNLILTPCLNTTYDATLAVYDTCICPNDSADQIACVSGTMDSGCGEGQNQNVVVVPVVSGNCYLIRIGGVGDSVGSGRLIVGCIPADGGACCLGPDNCVVSNAAECSMMGGDFTAGEPCSPLTCPAIENDQCDGAITISEGVYAFDTTDAMSDGPMDSPGGVCTDVTKDIWYSYTASCNGQLRVSLCNNTMFDAAIAVYAGLDCPPLAGPLACDDNGCGPDGPAEVFIDVSMGDAFLIRVGGADGAAGAGELLVTCTPGGACCLGDVNLDTEVTIDDVDAFVIALLDPPGMMDPSFCPSDTNEDGAVNGDDITGLIDLIVNGNVCGGVFDPMGACCYPNGSCFILTQLECFMTNGNYSGNGTLCVPNMCPPPPPPPVNDDCENAIMLSCNTEVVVNNRYATTSGSDPEFSCKFNGPGRGVGTVWYTFIATETDALISTCNSMAPVNDTLLAVYEGTCPSSSGDEIACVEDAGGACGRLAQVCVEGLVPGNQYTIQIASFDFASVGDIAVELMCPCPRGACCYPDSSCVELRENDCIDSGGSYKGDGVTCASNPCPPPPMIECCKGDANGDGVVDAGDVAALATAVLNPPLASTPAHCVADVNDDGSVDGDDIQAFIPLALAETACPPLANDDCASAMTITCGLSVIVDNTQATTAGNDPAFSCRAGGAGQGVGTLWFEFMATDTSARVRTCGSIPPATDTILAVYNNVGCPPTQGDEIGCSEDAGLPCGERLSEACVSGLTIGQTYLIQVASFDEASRGFISVEVECPCQ
ncbi:MAG: hypothetical protein H6819_09080 [Phycisphaerales bacterium]|nr:hypothetical protein [Phycisphaerales bacterium]MCB9856019.1 hypothetical protein [Phycisphaerales bacterium]